MNINSPVYSIEGKIIKELVNGYRGQGEYKVHFSADNLSSGIYNYVLETENGQRESETYGIYKINLLNNFIN